MNMQCDISPARFHPSIAVHGKTLPILGFTYRSNFSLFPSQFEAGNMKNLVLKIIRYLALFILRSSIVSSTIATTLSVIDHLQIIHYDNNENNNSNDDHNLNVFGR